MSQLSYTIKVRNKMLERWHALEDEYPDEMQELKDFLKQYPTNAYAKKDKVKKLRGDLKRFYQYDVSHKDRVRYSVDKESRIVEVVFAKGHP
ncbi:hypothetical protein ACFLWI_02045 [Chloroflexota bacterium]